MSRSYRKYPMLSPSKKSDKEYASRLLRRIVKQRLSHYDEEDDLVFIIPREAFDLWWSGSGDSSCKFDPQEYPHLLRK